MISAHLSNFKSKNCCQLEHEKYGCNYYTGSHNYLKESTVLNQIIFFFPLTKQDCPSARRWGANVTAGEGFVLDLLSTILLNHFQLQNLYVSVMKRFQSLNCLPARQLTSLIEQNSARIIDLYLITEPETFQGASSHLPQSCRGSLGWAAGARGTLSLTRLSGITENAQVVNIKVVNTGVVAIKTRRQTITYSD